MKTDKNRQNEKRPKATKNDKKRQREKPAMEKALTKSAFFFHVRVWAHSVTSGCFSQITGLPSTSCQKTPVGGAPSA